MYRRVALPHHREMSVCVVCKLATGSSQETKANLTTGAFGHIDWLQASEEGPDVEQPATDENAAVKAGGDTTSESGFTPIEMLTAITLLTIGIAVFIPQMLSASEEVRRNTLLQRLHAVRGNIEQFRNDNSGRLPAEGMNSADEFVRELTNFAIGTDRTGSVDDSDFLREDQFPLLNPYTQKSEILVVPDGLDNRHYSGSGRHGWAYSSTTGEFRSNLSPEVTDRSGRLINQL